MVKVWLALQASGVEGHRKTIERNLQLADHVEGLVRGTPGLSVAAFRQLSIVCWRVEPPGLTDYDELERLQIEVINELEARGIEMISNARLLDGRNALRACIVNFLTTIEDVEAIVKATASIGLELTQSFPGREP